MPIKTQASQAGKYAPATVIEGAPAHPHPRPAVATIDTLAAVRSADLIISFSAAS
jgi:hypothetical protein